MSHRLGRHQLIASLVIAGAAVGPIATARAGDVSLRATVKRDVPAITRSQARITAAQATLRRTHSTTKLLKAVRAQDTVLEGLRTKLEGETPSSATGAEGRTDIVKGLKLIVDSNRALIKDVEQEAMGVKVSQARVKALVRNDRRGSALFDTGARLLDV